METPLLSPLECHPPVTKLKDGIPVHTTFIGGPDGLKVILASGVAGGIVGHKIGCAEDDILPLIESFSSGVQAVIQCGEKDRGRFLPKQRRLRRVSVIVTIRAGGFRPHKTVVIEVLRDGAGDGRDALVNGERLFGHGPAIPQGIVREVPPDHLKVPLGLPGIGAGKADLRGRVVAGGLHGQFVLREDDPALDFHPTRILAARKINGAAAFPE